MADKPQNPPVDPDAPTEQSVKQTLAQLPTWEEWLAQNQFIKGEKHRSAISAVEWNRDFPKYGRGWRLRVAPAMDTINIIVYNATLGRKVNQIAMVSVGERSVVNILTKLITEIERPVSDVTKKRRIRGITSAVEYEEREEKPEFVNGPVMTPDNIQQLRSMGLMRQQEAGPIRRPVPDDPNELNPDQFDQLLNRLQVRCFQKGQRVRVRAARSTRLNGELGTVVDASPHAAYVALDSYVEAGDPDPFRFEEQELEAVFESIENVDDPEPYMDALDYVTPLKGLGYRLLNGAYTKSLLLGEQVAGYLRIKVHPRDAGVIVYIDYQAHGEMEHIAEMSISAIETIDVVREVEQMAADAKTASEFTRRMQERQFPNAVVVGREGHLYYLFGEAVLESDDPDDPQPYFQELQRHADVINAFREHGVKMRRRMKADRPYYAMFWIPNAVTDVSYDIFLQPDGEGWSVSAEGNKRFDHDRWGQFDEEFSIDHTWYITTSDPQEIAAEVDEILSSLTGYTGPEEPTVPEPDYDDIDESVDDEIGDYEAYAKASAGWNPVRMLTSKQIRQFVREAGFKVSTIYRSRTDHGWSVTATPATAQAFEVFQQNPHRMAEFMEHTAREAIKKLMPNLAKIERGMYNLDDKLYVHAWEWSGSTSADPSNPNNWTIYLDIRPADYQKYRRGGIKEAEDPDDIKDVLGYFKGATDAVKVLEEFGYAYGFDRAGRKRWNKYIDMPQPVRTREPWSPVWSQIWLSPDVHGQLVYGLLSKDHHNASETGYIIVRPLKRPAGVDDYDIVTSIRRMLLKAEDVVRKFPVTESLVEAKQYLHNEMRRVQEEVNKEADATWVEEAVDPDDPTAYVDRARAAKMGDTVEVKCPGCGAVKLLGKNWPDDLKGWGTTCDKCQAFIPLGGEIVMDAVPEPDADPELADPMAYAMDTLTLDAFMRENRYHQDADRRYWYKNIDDETQFVIWTKPEVNEVSLQLYREITLPNSGMKHWQLQAALDGISFGKLKGSLLTWEERVHRADAAFWQQPGALARITEGVDDPEEVLPQHQPSVYSLYGEYASYRSAVSFGVYTTLEAAVQRALERHLHEEYDYVWAEEDKVKSLEDWDRPNVKVCTFTGSKYIINSDGTTKLVKVVDPEMYHIPPQKVRESEDVDNPEHYIQTTFDPRQFLEQYGWQTYKHEAYEYWHRDYPLPHSYYLGGMRFNIIRLVVGFDLRFRGAYSCVVQTFWAARPEAGEDWIDMTKASMPGNNWHLLQQRVYPEQEDETDDFTDANMPLRRFVMGIDRVMAGIAWPDTDNALVANIELERALARFIHELNDVAEAPIHDQHPMAESS